jgi:hypothetical protein
MHTGELCNAFRLTGRQLLVPAPGAYYGLENRFAASLGDEVLG